jgi:endonuclease/exonuclease/phosphatase family metal-dependent hydrolase
VLIRDTLASAAVLIRLHEETVDELPAVPAARRRELAAALPRPDAHAQVETELGVFHAVEHAPPPARHAQPRELRVVAWNLERGRLLAPAAAVLSRTRADVVLLSEMDAGMARTEQHHTTRSLAAALGHGYAFAVEFLELGLGSPEERARCAGQENALGLHGGAIASRLPLGRPAVVRLDEGGHWLDGSRGEARLGGRIAVLATVRAGGADVAFASVHLESHSDPGHRAQQMRALLEALEAYAPGAPAVIGGDLNTLTMPTADFGDPAKLREALAADPERLLRPERHEPLFALAREAGFAWKAANPLACGTCRRREGEGSRRIPLRLDWLLVRGVTASAPEVIDAVDLATGEALSDHEALAVTVRPPARRTKPG